MTRYRRTFSSRRFRSPYWSRGGNTGLFAAVAAGLALAAAGAHHAAVPHGKAHAKAAPAAVTAAVSGTGEPAFWAAVLADLGAPDTGANVASLTAWADREGPWGTVGQWNPLDTTLTEPGSWAFNTFSDGLHVQSYPSASEGAEATAATLADGYPLITAALRSGDVCGNAGLADEFSRWSGGGYEGVC
jgi:hypothetical protein